MKVDGTFNSLSKRERLQIDRQREKLELNLGSISEMNRLPAAVFVVDIMREHIAIDEARKLGIPTFAIVDTNSNPQMIDFPIPANDDASKAIAKIMEVLTGAVKDGLSNRKTEKNKASQEKLEKKAAQVGE
jgi:small subunit ribosomal protein S2